MPTSTHAPLLSSQGVSNFLCQQLLAGGSLPLPAATATATLAAAPPPAQAAVTIPLAPPPASEASLAQEASLVLPAAPAAAPVAESSSTSPAAPTPSAAANPPQTGTEAASTQGARSSESGEVKPAEGASPAGAEKPAEAVPDPAQQDIPAAEAIPASDTELPAHASPAGNLADSPPAAQDSGVPASDTSAGSVAGSAAAESATAADNGAGSPPAAQEGEVPANASSADLLSIAGKIAGSAAANKAPKSAAADLPSVATDGAAGKQKAATNNAAVSADSQQSPRQRSARKSAQVSPRPEWRFEQQEGQQGSPRPLSPATVTDPASQPQWVLDAQVARIVRAQNEAAMQAVSDAAQALAGNKGLALGLVNRLRATSASASASASVEGHPIASGELWSLLCLHLICALHVSRCTTQILPTLAHHMCCLYDLSLLCHKSRHPSLHTQACQSGSLQKHCCNRPPTWHSTPMHSTSSWGQPQAQTL